MGRPLRFDELEPSLAEWHLETERADGTPFQMQKKMAVIPERIFPVRAAEKNVRVDGVLDEWGPMPHWAGSRTQVESGVEHHRGTQDSFLEFDLRYDDDFLYLAAHVADDELALSGKLVPTNQDALILTVDSRPDPARSRNRALKKSLASRSPAPIVYTAISPAAAESEPPAILLRQLWPEGMLGATRRTVEGFAVELAIPVAFLDRAAGAPWEHLRVNLGVSDWDGHTVRAGPSPR